MINIDFETFSAAGLRFDHAKQSWAPLEGCSAFQKGLPGIGAEVYAAHPSTRVICMDWGGNIWHPGEPIPTELCDHITGGGLLSAWNSQFEWWVWRYQMAPNGWPELPLDQIVDSMPRARAISIPASLGGAAKVLGCEQQKDEAGKGLIRKHCMPRKPTRADRRLVIPAGNDMDAYCSQDVATEADLATRLPELSPFEFDVWKLDQEINVRGIPIDVEAVENACEILRQSDRVLESKMQRIAGCKPTQDQKIKKWLAEQGVKMPDMTADTVDEVMLRDDLPEQARAALRVRQQHGSRSTKKVWSMRRTLLNGRIHGTTVYAGADRTARWSGRKFQPQNLPRPDAPVCELDGVYGSVGSPAKWSGETTRQFIESMACRDYVELERRWGDVLEAMASSLRGFIKAPPGREFICSDYTAIEAVVLAALAGEDWRLEVFRTHGKIYEMSASKITGTPLEEYLAYAERNGDHHPDRQGLGKVAELASGYQGGVGAWIRFGADRFFTPERCEADRGEWTRSRYAAKRGLSLQEFVIQKQVWAWREASPKIAAFWDDLEAAAKDAINTPGAVFPVGVVSFQYVGGTLECTLPSGRKLHYQQAHMAPGKHGDAVHYYGTLDDRWVLKNTYGGKLTENIVQAVARDILAHGMLNVDRAGYPIIFHVHDEIIGEVPAGWGSVEEFEKLMGDLPTWAADWPVRAAGGWRGERYRK